MNTIPAIWHSVSCACEGCLHNDAIYVSGVRIPKLFPLFEIEEEPK